MRVCDRCKTPLFRKNIHVICNRESTLFDYTYSKITELCDDCYELLMDYIKGEQEERMAIQNDYYISAAVGTVVCQEKHRRDKEEKSKARKNAEDFSLIFDNACKAVSERSEVLVCKEVSDEQNTNRSTTGLVYMR